MKFRKWLMIAAFAVASALSFTLAACTDQGSGTGNGDPNHGGSSVVEGPESGVYYFGAGSDEYLVTLSGGNRFSLHMLGTDKSGTYEMEGNAITFDFLQDAYWAAYVPGQSEYTVSFDLGGTGRRADPSLHGGQRLVSGMGKPARSLSPGDVVVIPANVKHWHGAKKDSWFSHIAVEVPGEETANEWQEPVPDEEYGAL